MYLSSVTSSAYPFQYARAVGILCTRIFNIESLLKLTSFIIPSVHFKMESRQRPSSLKGRNLLHSTISSNYLITIIQFSFFPYPVHIHFPIPFLGKMKNQFIIQKKYIRWDIRIYSMLIFSIRFPLAVRFLSVISQNYSNSDVRVSVEVCRSDHRQHYHFHCCFHFPFTISIVIVVGGLVVRLGQATDECDIEKGK